MNRVTHIRPEGFDEPGPVGTPGPVSLVEAPPEPIQSDNPVAPAPGRFRGMPPAAARLAPARRRYEPRSYGAPAVAAPPRRDELAEAIDAGTVTIDDMMNQASPRFDESFPNVVEAEYVDFGPEDMDRARCKANGEKYVTPAEALALERKRGRGDDHAEGYQRMLSDLRAAAQQGRAVEDDEAAQVGRGLAPKDVAHGVNYPVAPDVPNFPDEPDGPPDVKAGE